MTKLTGIILLMIFTFVAINAQSNDNREQKAKDVLEKARRALFAGLNPEKLTGFRLQREGNIHKVTSTISMGEKVSDTKTEDKKIESEILFFLPNKARIASILYSPEDNPAENYIKTESIFNDAASVEKTNLYRNGRQVDLNLILSKIPKAFYEQVKEGLSAIKETEKKSSENKNAWLEIFPVLLSNPWSDQTQFKWAGKADIAGTKTDMLEVNLNKNERIRFFFDENTNLLVLMTSSNISETGINEEKKVFFSNYEKTAGIMVSKKILIETTTLSPKIEIALEGTPHKVESRKTREIQEFSLKELKLNPALKSDEFDFQKK